jgi:hypothetical protein
MAVLIYIPADPSLANPPYYRRVFGGCAFLAAEFVHVGRSAVSGAHNSSGRAGRAGRGDAEDDGGACKDGANLVVQRVVAIE